MTCSVEGCSGKIFTKKSGLCQKHYSQIWRHGQISRTIYEPNDFLIEGDICRIVLRDVEQNIVGIALIDAEDLERCQQYKWHLHSQGYACANPKRRKTILLHDFILGVKDVDHKDRDKLNNLKSNLRPATPTQNQGNRCIPKGRQYKGVSWHPIAKRWRARVGSLHLGLFDSMEEAAAAYNAKAVEVYGPYARLNVIEGGNV